MALLGLSILVASISFLCYKHPPWSWSLAERFRRPIQTIQDSTEKRHLDAPAPPTNHDRQTDSSTKSQVPSIPPYIERPRVSKSELDREAMPPPPPSFRRPPTTTPSTTKPPTIPSFNLIPGHKDDDDGDITINLPPPSFPAANSAQRASGARYPPTNLPSSQFPAANSAQRASGGARAPPRLPPVQQSSGLMAPPTTRSPLPNRGPPSSSLALPPTHNAPPTKPRKKVLLTPGHSPLDWAILTSSPHVNLRGLPPATPYLRVSPSLLKQYTGRKGKDAWTVLGGKVYNITPYLPYHPGGEPELLRCAGRDGSKLFGEVHPWVNWEGMLEGCLVGLAVEEGEVKRNEMEEMD